MTRKQKSEAKKIAAQIAAKILDIETLKTRKMDSLDFHEVAVWDVEEALLAAFQAGQEQYRHRFQW